MNKIFRSIFLLKSFSTGLLMPVMSLMIIARGVPLARLAIVVGVYSLTVVVLEFPSGVFCDLVGRKKCFLLSCVLMLISLAVILAGGEGMAVMAAAFVIQGTGRAFASGSLDALVIERSKTLGGDEAVAKTSGELGVLESVGIALGSVAGGILGGLGHAYGANLMTMTVVYIIIAALVLTGVEEKGRTKTETADREVSGIRRQIKAFGQQMKGSLSFSWKSLSVRMLMILIFLPELRCFLWKLTGSPD